MTKKFFKRSSAVALAVGYFSFPVDDIVPFALSVFEVRFSRRLRHQLAGTGSQHCTAHNATLDGVT